MTKVQFVLGGRNMVAIVDHSNNWIIETEGIPERVMIVLQEQFKRAAMAPFRRASTKYFPGPSARYASLVVEHLGEIFAEAPMKVVETESDDKFNSRRIY